jgi:hypothetical protein
MMTALKFKGAIVNDPDIFSATAGHTYNMTDMRQVQYRDTVCLFFETSQGVPIRVEGDIDRNYDGEYQMGSYRPFWNNRRNKHLEITTVDIERYGAVTNK